MDYRVLFPIIAFFVGLIMIVIFANFDRLSQALRRRAPKRFPMNPGAADIIEWPILGLIAPQFREVPIGDYRKLLDPRFRFLTPAEADDLQRRHRQAHNYKILAKNQATVVMGKIEGFDPGSQSIEPFVPTGTTLLVVQVA